MFAPKVAKSQTKADASSTNGLALQRSTLAAHRRDHGAVEQGDMLQRRIGNQASLWPPSQRTSSLTGNQPGRDHEREADPENRMAGEAYRGVAWDFGKIRVFPPDRPSGPQTPSPLFALPLPGIIQPKLVVGQVDDPLEHEADRVADQVMRMPAPGVSVAAAPQLGRKCDACEEEEKFQTKLAAPQAAAGEAPGIVHEVLRSPGQPIDAASRGYFEPRFGRDFSKVRVHTDDRAANSAHKIHAKAYTVGHDIVFAAGRYAVESQEGRHLLAHELAHVVQQAYATPMIRRAPEKPISWYHMRGPEVLEAKGLLNQYHQQERAAGRNGFGKGWRPLIVNDYVDDLMPPALNMFQRQKHLRHQDSALWRETLDALKVATAPSGETQSPGASSQPSAAPPEKRQPPAASTQPSPVAQSTAPGKLDAVTGHVSLGTKVIDDVERLQQQGANIETARAVAFKQLKILVPPASADVKPTAEDHDAAVAKIAAAMAGLKIIEPSMLSEGKLAHIAIGTFYQSLNQPTLVDPSLITIIRALKLTEAAYNQLYARLPEELLESIKVRPDIMDLGKLQVYEIKSFGSAARAIPEMLAYIELLESFKIPGVGKDFRFSPGSPSNPGTAGFLPNPEGSGWIVYCCPWPGAIIYRTILPMENPRNAEERLKDELKGTSALMVGVESWTAIGIVISVALVETYPLLIRLLTEAATKAGQPILSH